MQKNIEAVRRAIRSGRGSLQDAKLIDELAWQARKMAEEIEPKLVIPSPEGTAIVTLPEAALGVTEGLLVLADAIHVLAEVVVDKSGK